MALIWLLVLLILIFALVGGVAISHWLFILLVIVVIIALVMFLSGRRV